jgi:hypothetical protein
MTLPWKVLQTAVWLVGIGIVAALLFRPALGTLLFWDVLIPVAPALLVVAASLWRNVCPLATTSLLPERFGLSRKRKLTFKQQQGLLLAGTLALFGIIPLRHVLFDNDGRATGFLLLGTALVAVALGCVYERKSVWCNGLCPLHPVEKLYGAKVAASVPNLHCGGCVNCALPCPDSLPTSARALPASWASRCSSLLMVGAFPGYVWGWFQQPDYVGAAGWQMLGAIYGYPAAGGAATLALYLLLTRGWPTRRELLMHAFAAAAVSCYYVFRLPQLFGFNPMHSNDVLVLVDLTPYLPGWSMPALNVATTAFFFWWLVWRSAPRTRWSPRPPYAARPSSGTPSSAPAP